MPRDGALTLADVRVPVLTVVCEPCGRRERHDVESVNRAPEMLEEGTVQAIVNCRDLIVPISDNRGAHRSSHQYQEIRYIGPASARRVKPRAETGRRGFRQRKSKGNPSSAKRLLA